MIAPLLRHKAKLEALDCIAWTRTFGLHRAGAADFSFHQRAPVTRFPIMTTTRSPLPATAALAGYLALGFFAAYWFMAVMSYPLGADLAIYRDA